jgi:hypothetical protein
MRKVKLNFAAVRMPKTPEGRKQFTSDEFSCSFFHHLIVKLRESLESTNCAASATFDVINLNFSLLITDCLEKRC